MKIIKKVREKIQKMRKNDPLYSCKLFNEMGCSHVDGPLCDYPECSMFKKYLETNK